VGPAYDAALSERRTLLSRCQERRTTTEEGTTETVETANPPRTATPPAPSGGSDGAPRRTYHLEIFLVSLAGLLLQIAYTRIMSFKLYYYYTYLVIGLSLLGIGCGAVLVTISKRLRKAETETIVKYGLFTAAASVAIGYVVIAVTSIDTRAIWEYGSLSSFGNVGRLLIICFFLFASFVAIGVIVATLLGRRTEDVGRLYFADLLGAGLACAVVVWLLGEIGPPATVALAGLILAAAGLRLAWGHTRIVTVIGAALVVILAVATVKPGWLPDEQVDATKVQLSDDNTIYSSWSPLFRVDVTQPTPGVRLLYHDGLIGSAIYEFDGDVSSLTRFDTDPRSLPFDVADAPDDVLIIGAAGGHEILASLYFDAKHIDAIELNPVTYGLVTDEFADYSGHLAENPKVNYVKGDGRSYLARSDDKYNVIWYPAPDSYSASNAASSGAFVLSESYLYTSETIESSLEHLKPGGVLAAQFGEFDYDGKPNRTTRYVATARKALEDMGIEDPTNHVLVATSPAGDAGSNLSTILVSRTPFTKQQVSTFLTSLEDIPGATLRYAPGNAQDNSVSELVALKPGQLDQWYDDYPYNVRPISDNGPFFWHFTPFDSVISDFDQPIDRTDFEDSIGERVLLLLLAVAVLFAAVFLLLPFFAIRSTWSSFPRKGRSAVYFAALGFGFMFFEIALIQRLTLFLGYPTYSLTVTLMSILIATGVGALLSERFKHRTNRAIPILFGVLAVLTVFYLFGMPAITDAALGWSLAPRIALTILMLAPLGLCLGMFMPLGLGAVSELSDSPHEYVAWGWAVNGFASVVGAVLTTILAMSFGFNVVLAAALAIYAVAMLMLRALTRPLASATA
jgi:hypothetical protein